MISGKRSTRSVRLGLIRPKTLSASLSPVVMGLAYAATHGSNKFNPIDALLCIIVAGGAQIASNIANDYFDYRHGIDTPERIGPQRPLAAGLIKPKEVLAALGLSLAVTVAAGLGIVLRHEWWLLFAGLGVCVGIFAYSCGPYPLSHHALGEFAVLLFYGLVPFILTVYLQTGVIDGAMILPASAIGLANVNILLVNNIRDAKEDGKTGKKTLIVCLGTTFGQGLYLVCGLLSVFLLYPFYSLLGVFLLLPYLAFFLYNFLDLMRSEGKDLNPLLLRSSLSVLFLAFIAVALMLLQIR